MNNFSRTLGAAAAALLISAGASFADTNPPAATGSSSSSSAAKPAKMANMKKSEHHASVRSEASKSCSAQADAKSLHGKDRREFRRTCLKSANLSSSASKSGPAKKSASAAPAKHAANSYNH